jgi:peptidyl-prolyl cis-trans isomerase SurA
MARCRPFFLILLLSPLLVLAGCGGSTGTSGSSSAELESKTNNPVVATFGDSTLTLSEFEQAYINANQTDTPSSDSLAAYRDFLEQYVNYRLKVRAAREAGLDTLPSVRQEIASYRQNMAKPKVMRSNVYEPLARSLYNRQQEEVEVSHILKRVSPDAAPEDTLEAYREMQAIADSIKMGVPFGQLAYRNSEDPSAQKKGERGYQGNIGYVQAGQIVKPFEDRMYSVPPDSVSDIFRTKFGYHILKVHDRRSSEPPIRLSHIMRQPKSDSARPRQFLDSLRTLIRRDRADFSSLAKKHSQDRRSASRGGDLGKIQSRQSLPPSFRKAVAKLNTVGTVSDVVKSRFGYHLIKLTGRDEQPTFQEAYEDLKEKISGRPRVERRKDTFARQVRSEEGVTVDTSRILEAADVSSPDSLSRTLLSILEEDLSGSPSVATLGDSTYALDRIARHVMQTDGGAQMTIGEGIDDFLNKKALNYAATRLAERDGSFAQTMKDYREGLLVFQFMQDSVWNVATQDTSGLRDTYQKRRDQYRYPDRVRTLTFRAPTDSLLSPYNRRSADTSAHASMVEMASNDSLVTVDTVMVTNESSKPYQQVLSVTDGSVIGPLDDAGESLVLVRDTLLPARTKRFEEAQSSVIRDYQKLYEDEVLSRLRQRYDVETDPSRLRGAFNDKKQDAPSPRN